MNKDFLEITKVLSTNNLDEKEEQKSKSFCRL